MDVWALGCILFTLAFREHPFSSESPLQILNAGENDPAKTDKRTVNMPKKP